jgi:hypothetical protein
VTEGTAMIKLIDVESGRELGRIDEKQKDFLIDRLEEESSTDRDYYLEGATIDFLAESGADTTLLGVLRAALGTRTDVEIRWENA